MVDARFFSKLGEFSLKELAEKTKGRVVGDEHFIVKDVATLKDAAQDELSFLANQKYLSQFKQSKAGVCLVLEKDVCEAPEGMNLIVVEDPYFAYAIIADIYYPARLRQASSVSGANCSIASSTKIHPSAIIGANCVIEEEVEIGEGTVIGHNVTIMRGVIIGNDCEVRSNTTLSHCIIGKGCIIYPGARIGQDGFGFAISSLGVKKMNQLGRVVIGNYVEIGANACVDRGAIGDTIIGDGSKLDNLVQLGHNVTLGRSCFMAGQAGISGSTNVADGVLIGGQAGIAGHLEIGAQAQIAAQSGVIGNVDAKAEVVGFPAMGRREFFKMIAIQKINLKKKKGE